MQYRSDAQRRAFHAKAARGEISEDTVREWDQASKGKRLPERVGGKEHKDTEIPKMDKLSKGGFQAFLKKKAGSEGGPPKKEDPPFGGMDEEMSESEGPECPHCGGPMKCPVCMEKDEENEGPDDEESESPSYQKAEKKFGIEKH